MAVKKKKNTAKPVKAQKPKSAIVLKRKDGLYLQDTKSEKGRGVFCLYDIKKGEQLEITPSMVLNDKENELIDKTILVNYNFVIADISQKVKKQRGVKKVGECSAVVYGMLTFCNHSETPNATILQEEKNGTLYYILKAIRNIPKYTEICTTYGDGWFEDR